MAYVCRHHKKTSFPEMPEYTTWVTDGNRALQQLGSECVKLHAHVQVCVETLDRTIGQVEKSMSLLSTTFGEHGAAEAVKLARMTYANANERVRKEHEHFLVETGMDKSEAEAFLAVNKRNNEKLRHTLNNSACIFYHKLLRARIRKNNAHHLLMAVQNASSMFEIMTVIKLECTETRILCTDGETAPVSSYKRSAYTVVGDDTRYDGVSEILS